MSPQALAELLAMIARLPGDQARKVRDILLEAGFDLDRPGGPQPAVVVPFLLVMALAAVVGLVISLLIAILLTR